MDHQLYGERCVAREKTAVILPKQGARTEPFKCAAIFSEAREHVTQKTEKYDNILIQK